MDAITTALQSLTGQLMGLSAPLAILGIVVFILSFLISPLLPDAMGSMKGYMQRAMLGVAFLSFVPAIITGLAGLSGSGG